jgi:hypothetical protein
MKEIHLQVTVKITGISIIVYRSTTAVMACPGRCRPSVRQSCCARGHDKRDTCNFTGKEEFLNLYNTGLNNYPANFAYPRGNWEAICTDNWAAIVQSIQRLSTGRKVRGSNHGVGGSRFSSPAQTCPRAHPVSSRMGTGSLSWRYSGRGVGLTTHPNIAPRLKKE